MKGVIATRAPGVPVVDVSHGVPREDVMAGALVLRAAVPWFPSRTVHVAVVDPGVGSDRRAICIEIPEGYLVGPDNGVLSLAAPPERAVRVVELQNERYMLSPRSATFHGRDVFAPVAAALATGTSPAALGPICADPIRVELPKPLRRNDRVEGVVAYVDVFGNLATSLDEAALPTTVRRVEIGGRSIPGLSRTYADVAPGRLVALINSWGLLEIAVRDGDARDVLGVGVGTTVGIVGT